jgi:hypothetical protein
MIPNPHWDAGSTLGRNKAPTRIKPLISWTPSPWKAFPQHITLRKLEDCHCCHSCCHWLQTCLGDIWQTKLTEEKKHYSQANHLARPLKSFCFYANTRTGYWRSNYRTKWRLKFYCSWIWCFYFFFVFVLFVCFFLLISL